MMKFNNYVGSSTIAGVTGSLLTLILGGSALFIFFAATSSFSCNFDFICGVHFDTFIFLIFPAVILAISGLVFFARSWIVTIGIPLVFVLLSFLVIKF